MKYKKPTKKQLRNAKQVHMGPFVRPVCWSDYNDSYCVCHKCWSCKRKMKYNTRDFANNVAIKATQRTNTVSYTHLALPTIYSV